ncbi:HNH endonuclease [Streptomyces phage Coruscant]|uniref:HNH endonuclease n=1 Tax=Streptomyces phage Coruscant TaxID=2739834 RepID=A0A7G4AVW5_9CAUD|nr:endonuclease [Streptomyces phage Coruscant]QMP84155.1 HNH endonuclease [Streptomyces phage Coruscant]
MSITQNDINRFWSKVNKTSGCWNWKGSVSGSYGRFRLGSNMLYAHRLSFILNGGTIGDDQMICHTCDNTKCVNPAHLYAGSQKDNMQDKANRDRGTSLFTNSQVEIMRTRAANGEELADIAKDLSVPYGQEFINAVTGKTFKHLKVKPVSNTTRKVRKLSDQDIADILKAFERPSWGLANRLAKKYGVSHTAISLIRNGKYKN